MPQTRRDARRDCRWKITLVIVCAAVLYLVGNASVPLWDRDEPRYAQTSRQMLATGDWVVPRLLDEVRTAKPVLIYWLQAASMRAFGVNEFAARLPSAVAMLLTLLMLAVVVYHALGPRRALWTALVLASSGLVIAAAKMCITDAVLLLWVTIAQICLLATYARHQRGDVRSWMLPLMMWLAVGLAGLTKGPVVLGVMLMTMLALLLIDVGGAFRERARWRDAIRWWRDTRPLVGLLILALVCGPWLFLVERRAPGFVWTSLWHDVITRSRTSLEGHSGPPGYYLLTIWLTYFPWSLLIPATLVWAWRRRANPVHRYCLAAIVGPWVMFELVQTKLVHYVLPVFPALAILTADLLVRGSRRVLTTNTAVVAARVWWALVALAGLAPWVSTIYFDVSPDAVAVMALVSVLAVAYGGAVYARFRARRPLDAAALMGGGMILVIAVLYGLYLPRAAYLQTSKRVAQILRAEGAVDPGDAVMIDYREDSLPFYQSGTIRRQANTYLLNTPRWEWPRWVVVTDRVWSLMPAEVRDEFDEVGRVRGWWYAKGGRVVEVIVLRKKSPFAIAPPFHGADRVARNRSQNASARPW